MGSVGPELQRAEGGFRAVSREHLWSSPVVGELGTSSPIRSCKECACFMCKELQIQKGMFYLSKDIFGHF